MKKIAAFSFLLMVAIACSSTKNVGAEGNSSDIPAGWITKSQSPAFQRGEAEASQPCPSNMCAVPMNTNVKSIYDTGYSCVECKSLEEPKADVVKSVCPENMVEIDGEYCSATDEKCLYWVDSYGKRTDVMTDRCGEFRNPVHCLGRTVHKHFCMDKFEIPNKEGVIPRDWMSFYDVKKFCETEGKRMCTANEWTTAASGPELRPYPFADGFHRDHSCNIDRHIKDVGITGDQVMHVSDPNSDVAKALRSQLVPSGSLPDCHSSYGIYDMSGNVDEFVINERGVPYISALVGGHAWGVRNRSNANVAITLAHAPTFEWYESNGRCCLTP